MKRKHPLFLAALALLLVIPAAQAAVFTPDTFDDSTSDGNCSAGCTLRDAVMAANANPGFDAILLEAGTYRLTFAGGGEDTPSSGDLDVLGELSIIGEGAGSTFIEADSASPGWNHRVIDVLAGATLELQGVTVRKGRTNGQPGAGIRVAGELLLSRSVVSGNIAAGSTGGGIYVEGQDAVANVVQSTIHGNQANSGGGAYVASTAGAGGTLNLTNSTVANNAALAGSGGGLYFGENAGGALSNSTISRNSATQKGGGIFKESAPFTSIASPVLRNTILAGNLANAADGDCSGPVDSAGHNLLGDGAGCPDFEPGKGDLEGTAANRLDPKLSNLSELGGPTPTLGLLAGSPALDKGENCEDEDQRGADRPAACDIGAFEVTSQCVSGGANLCLNDGRFQVQATWQTNQSNGTGSGVQLTDDSGYVWFFDPANVELTIKVLDGCGVNGRYWVFLGGLTNVGVQVTVTDTQTGVVKTYNNPINRTFAPVLDTNAFNTCP